MRLWSGWVNAIRALVAIAVLLITGCDDSGKRGEVSSAAPGSAERQATGTFKERERDERTASIDGGSAQRIEAALEAGDHEKALEGLRDLVDTGRAASEEFIHCLGDRQGQVLAKDPLLLKLSDRIDELNRRIAVAEFEMRSHQVESASIDALIKEQRGWNSRRLVIGELSELDSSWVR